MAPNTQPVSNPDYSTRFQATRCPVQLVQNQPPLSESHSSQQISSNLPDASVVDCDLDSIDPRQCQNTLKRKAEHALLSPTKPTRSPMRRPTPSPHEKMVTALNNIGQDSNIAVRIAESPGTHSTNRQHSRSLGSVTPIPQPYSSRGISTPLVASCPIIDLRMNNGTVSDLPRPFQFEKLQDDEGKIRIERYARQQFICTLNNQDLDVPVHRAFPGMSSSHPKYKEAINKVRGLYRTWKSRTLTEASNFFEEIIVPDHNRLADSTTMKELGSILVGNFHPYWLPRVFPWANEVVSLTECQGKSLRWLRYACIQLVARARLCVLYTRSGKTWQGLCRFDRESLLMHFDSLHTRSDLILDLNDLPRRAETVKCRYRKRQLA